MKREYTKLHERYTEVSLESSRGDLINVICTAMAVVTHRHAFIMCCILLSTHVDTQGVDISFTVCLFLFFVCLYGYRFLRGG